MLRQEEAPRPTYTPKNPSDQVSKATELGFEAEGSTKPELIIEIGVGRSE
jgi:hypothetical protein